MDLVECNLSLNKRTAVTTVWGDFWAQGHFTHEPRAMTMKLLEPERKCPKAAPTHLQNHVVWSRTFECSVKSNMTMPSTKCYFNVFLVMRVLAHDK
jgi:hypothetical protein